MEHKMFSTLSPLRLFFRCALPSMAGMAVSSLYMVADGIFVGKFIGSHALAAINLVMPVIMISFALWEPASDCSPFSVKSLSCVLSVRASHGIY